MGWRRRLAPIASNIECSVWWCIFYFVLTLWTRTWPGKHERTDAQEKKANEIRLCCSGVFLRYCQCLCVNVYAPRSSDVLGTDDFQCIFCCVASYTENFLFKVFCCVFHRFSYFPTAFTCSSQSRSRFFSAFDAICRALTIYISVYVVC